MIAINQLTLSWFDLVTIAFGFYLFIFVSGMLVWVLFRPTKGKEIVKKMAWWPFWLVVMLLYGILKGFCWVCHQVWSPD